MRRCAACGKVLLYGAKPTCLFFSLQNPHHINNINLCINEPSHGTPCKSVSKKLQHIGTSSSGTVHCDCSWCLAASSGGRCTMGHARDVDHSCLSCSRKEQPSTKVDISTPICIGVGWFRCIPCVQNRRCTVGTGSCKCVPFSSKNIGECSTGFLDCTCNVPRHEFKSKLHSHVCCTCGKLIDHGHSPKSLRGKSSKVIRKRIMVRNFPTTTKIPNLTKTSGGICKVSSNVYVPELKNINLKDGGKTQIAPVSTKTRNFFNEPKNSVEERSRDGSTRSKTMTSSGRKSSANSLGTDDSLLGKVLYQSRNDHFPRYGKIIFKVLSSVFTNHHSNQCHNRRKPPEDGRKLGTYGSRTSLSRNRSAHESSRSSRKPTFGSALSHGRKGDNFITSRNHTVDSTAAVRGSRKYDQSGHCKSALGWKPTVVSTGSRPNNVSDSYTTASPRDTERRASIVSRKSDVKSQTLRSQFEETKKLGHSTSGRNTTDDSTKEISHHKWNRLKRTNGTLRSRGSNSEETRRHGHSTSGRTENSLRRWNGSKHSSTHKPSQFGTSSNQLKDRGTTNDYQKSERSRIPNTKMTSRSTRTKTTKDSNHRSAGYVSGMDQDLLDNWEEPEHEPSVDSKNDEGSYY